MRNTLSVLEYSPFALSEKEKKPLFLRDMRRAVSWHYRHCQEYQSFCESQRFHPESSYEVSQIPYFPVGLFKQLDLVSVPKKDIVKTLYSSSTSGQPSKIMIDQITAERQRIAAGKILADFLGRQRRLFIVFDTEETVKSTQNGELSSRGTAIRGVLPLAKKLVFLLKPDFRFDEKKLQEIKQFIERGEPICFLGFTWLIYSVYVANRTNSLMARIFGENKGKKNMLLHLGGWKKLKDITVSKSEFNAAIKRLLFIERIIDLYGMTEQLGTIYLDCEYGNKHVPVYADIIIRDIATLTPLPKNMSGFIQLVSPIPHSYPGISILSDDIGKLVGVDNCPCGRKGKYFVFERRSEKAELKGCGDALNLQL